MADITLPDMTNIWASQGDKTAPDLMKFNVGWEVEIPPRQIENYIQWRQDTAINYLLQKGVPEWNSLVEYQANKSIVQLGGKLYLAIVTHTGVTPPDPTNWRRLNLEAGDFGTAAWRDVGTGPTELIESSRVVQTVGNSVTNIMSQKAVTDALGTALPPGIIVPFAANNPPTGWLICDGSAVSRTTYASLFNIIGTTYGVGNGSTTFNLPDLRNMFIRGIDASRAIGSIQQDQNKSHNHTGSTASAGNHTHSATTSVAANGNHSHVGSTSVGGEHIHGGAGRTGSGQHAFAENGGGYVAPTGNTTPAGAHSHSISTNVAGNHTHSASTSVAAAGAHTHAVTINNNGGTEARPINIGLNYIIKT